MLITMYEPSRVGVSNLVFMSFNLIRKETATLTYKSLNSLAPVYMKNLFTKYSDDRERSRDAH